MAVDLSMNVHPFLQSSPPGVVDDCGDFVSSNAEEEIKKSTEIPERYEQGLYYPIYIGEVLFDRYRIEHKLGHGNYSVVWMAYDLRDHKEVALKIMIPRNKGEREYHFQAETRRALKDWANLNLFQEAFLLKGSQGQYRMLVFSLQGPSLRDYGFQGKAIITRMSAAKQLLQALGRLHEVNIIHRSK